MITNGFSNCLNISSFQKSIRSQEDIETTKYEGPPKKYLLQTHRYQTQKLFTGIKVQRKVQKIVVGYKTVYEIDPNLCNSFAIKIIYCTVSSIQGTGSYM